MKRRNDSFSVKNLKELEEYNVDNILPERSDWFCNHDKPNTKNPDWMKHLDDNQYVYAYSFPGTHDSCARYGGLPTQTQSWNISHQLTAGIRFLDLRGRVVENVIFMYHGFVYQFISLENVLESFEQFLKENPSEGLIIRIKEEYDPLYPKDTFSNILINRYSKAFPGLFLLQDDYPTIKSLRGKVWICKDNLQINTRPFFTFNVQDHYDLNDDTVEHKNELILEQLSKSDKDKSELLYVNFCSATGILSNKFPPGIAKKTNKVVWDNKQFIKVGIIIMDFPGEKLIEDIIKKNFN